MAPAGDELVACQLWVGVRPFGVSGNTQCHVPSSRPLQPSVGDPEEGAKVCPSAAGARIARIGHKRARRRMLTPEMMSLALNASHYMLYLEIMNSGPLSSTFRISGGET